MACLYYDQNAEFWTYMTVQRPEVLQVGEVGPEIAVEAAHEEVLVVEGAESVLHWVLAGLDCHSGLLAPVRDN